MYTQRYAVQLIISIEVHSMSKSIEVNHATHDRVQAKVIFEVLAKKDGGQARETRYKQGW